jgi:flagellar assembly protein FliH
MPWSKESKGSGFNGPPRKAKTIMSKEMADQIALDFVPVRFDLGTPDVARDYLEKKRNGSDFRMNEVIRIQTGIEDLEKDNVEGKVELAALEKLKEIQEQAYQQAFSLGLEEGRREAFQTVSKEINARMDDLDTLFMTIKSLKKDLISFNETHLVTLVFQIASRLAKQQVEGNNEAIIQVLRDSISLAQDEEQVTVHVSPSQFKFLDELKNETAREFDFIKKIKFQANDDVTDGGCVVETNYGEVDARIEQRIEQLWVTLSESLFKVKDRIAS